MLKKALRRKILYVTHMPKNEQLSIMIIINAQPETTKRSYLFYSDSTVQMLLQKTVTNQPNVEWSN